MALEHTLQSNSALTSPACRQVLGLLPAGHALFAAKLFIRERQLILGGGREWKGLHMYAWAALTVVFLFQAPLFSTECASRLLPKEDEGSERCTIFMRSIGLYKLRSSDCTSGPCEGSARASEMLRLVFMWAMIDLQYHVFRNGRFRSVVITRYEASGRNGAIRRTSEANQLELLRGYHRERLAAWNAHRTLTLHRIERSVQLIRRRALSPGHTARRTAAYLGSQSRQHVMARGELVSAD